MEHSATLATLETATKSAIASINTYTSHNNAFTKKVEQVSSACQEFSGAKHFGETLTNVTEVVPLVAQLQDYQKE